MEAQIVNYKSQVQIGKLISDVSEILSIKSAFQIRYLDMIEHVVQKNSNVMMMVKMNIDDEKKV